MGEKLTHLFKTEHLLSYVDDTVVYMASKSPEELEATIEVKQILPNK